LTGGVGLAIYFAARDPRGYLKRPVEIVGVDEAVAAEVDAGRRSPPRRGACRPWPAGGGGVRSRRLPWGS